MMKIVNDIRYHCALLKNRPQIAIGFICLILFVILPIFSCYAEEGLLSSYSRETYLQYCNADAFNAKYGGAETSCWSCNIVAILMDTMIDIVQKISKAAIELAYLILIYGSAIWIGVFFLKSLSSATAQDPTQVLTALFTFMFKVALVYVLIVEGGFVDLVNWIVNPLLSIGIDIGTEFSYWGGA